MIKIIRGLVALTQLKCRKITLEVSNCSQPILICIILISFIPTCSPAPAFCESKTLIASWYSLESLKKEGTFKYSKGVCADGSKFDENAFTCASWDYPLHTKLRITNVKNPNKKVTAVVTDRTAKRFKGKRIDLSKKAFGELTNNQWTLGIIEVSVERIR